MSSLADALALLPHGAPFRLVDALTELVPGERVAGHRDVRPEEPWFAGHFPGNPILPGVIIIESLAQIGGILAGQGAMQLLAVDKAKLRRPVRPGERLLLSAVAMQRYGKALKVRGEARVGEDRVAEAELLLGGT